MVGAATIVVPFGEILKAGNLFVERSCLGSECDAGAVNPDVLSDNFTTLVKVEEIAVVLVIQVL